MTVSMGSEFTHGLTVASTKVSGSTENKTEKAFTSIVMGSNGAEDGRTGKGSVGSTMTTCELIHSQF